MNNVTWFALAVSITAIIYGLLLVRWILKKPAGSDKMQEIAKAIQDGAKAYLNRQYRVVAIIAIILTIAFWLWSWPLAVAFAIGAVFSGLAGFIGMNVSVRANVRTTEGAKTGLAEALKVAVAGGSVTGLLVVGLGLLGVAGFYWLMQTIGMSIDDTMHALIGLGFGGSLISDLISNWVIGGWFRTFGCGRVLLVDANNWYEHRRHYARFDWSGIWG